MREVRAVALALVALVGAVAVAAPAPVAGSGQSSPAGPPDAGGTAVVDGQSVASADAQVANDSAGTANNSSMGDGVATFMQSTAGQADEGVEGGLWNAAYANASNRSTVVVRRTNDIESRLATLRERKQTLEAAFENGSISRTEYRARLSRIVGQLAALNRSIEETERQANEAGVDESAVARLRQQARNLSGPEVAAIARSIAGGPPEDVPAGPPNGSQGPPDGSQGPANGSQGPPNGSQGPPNGTGEAPGNGSDSAGDGGQGNDGDGGSGNDGDGGQGNDGGGDSGQGNGGDDEDDGGPGNGGGGPGNSAIEADRAGSGPVAPA